MLLKNRYDIILELLCEMKGISKKELMKLLSDRECKYLLFLLMKKYDCMDEDRICSDLNNISKRTIKNNTNKAEERLLINYEFRKKFFELENIIDNIG